jgi:hypothetical protein
LDITCLSLVWVWECRWSERGVARYALIAVNGVAGAYIGVG